MSELKQDMHELVGGGQVLRFVVGSQKGEGGKREQIIEEYHFTPVALKDIPKLQDKLNGFFETSEKGAWNEEALKNAGELIVLSLKRMHDGITVEQVLEKFSLGGLAKAVRIAMDVNDFLSEMGEISKGLNIQTRIQNQVADLSQQKES